MEIHDITLSSIALCYHCEMLNCGEVLTSALCSHQVASHVMWDPFHTGSMGGSNIRSGHPYVIFCSSFDWLFLYLHSAMCFQIRCYREIWFKVVLQMVITAVDCVFPRVGVCTYWVGCHPSSYLAVLWLLSEFPKWTELSWATHFHSTPIISNSCSIYPSTSIHPNALLLHLFHSCIPPQLMPSDHLHLLAWLCCHRLPLFLPNLFLPLSYLTPDHFPPHLPKLLMDDSCVFQRLP